MRCGNRGGRTRAGRAVLALAVVLASVLPAPAAEDPHPKEQPVVRDDGRRTMRRLPANLGRGVVGIFHRDNLDPFLIGATATGIASSFDHDAQTHIGGGPPGEGWGGFLASTAGPIWSSVFVAGMFTGGRFSPSARFRAMTYDMLDAAIVNTAYTELLKVTVKRERPNGEDTKSFPSGHTSNAFTLATVSERHYGWRVAIPAYALATVVGASRLNQDKHHLSDVVAGAALGYVVGRTVVRVNGGRRGDEPAAVTVAPIVAGRTRGLQVSVVF